MVLSKKIMEEVTDTVFSIGINKMTMITTKNPRKMMKRRLKIQKDTIEAIICTLLKELMKLLKNWAKMLEVYFMAGLNPK
jgi:hypothetical protein